VSIDIVGVTPCPRRSGLAPKIPYVHPRSRKIRSKIGIGIPRSQSKMYPVAPASFILFVKRILVSFREVIARELLVCAETCLINENAQ
jgi:hypothetical protein